MNSKKNYPKCNERRAAYSHQKEKSNDNFRNTKREDNSTTNVVNTSERRILFYKTKICPWYIKGKCERKKTCLYAHAQNELRELPNLCKTSLCPKLKINELCNDKKCKYAHTNTELRATENLYKTALCESYIKGKCFAGQFCRYAHGASELREDPMEITDRNVVIGTNKNKQIKTLDIEKKKNSNTNNAIVSNSANGNIHSNNSKNNKHNKNINNGTGKNAHFRKSETFCVHPKKKEIYSKKFRSPKESNSCDVTETIDATNRNELTTENSIEGNKKRDGVAKKKKKTSKKFSKTEESVNFSEEQFFNDNLNVLGFLEEQHSSNNGETSQYKKESSDNEQTNGSMNNNCGAKSNSTYLNENSGTNHSIGLQNNNSNQSVYNDGNIHNNNDGSINNNNIRNGYNPNFDLKVPNTRDTLGCSMPMAMNFTMPNRSLPTGNIHLNNNNRNDAHVMNNSNLINSRFMDADEYVFENTFDNTLGYNDFFFNDDSVGSMRTMNLNGNINSMSTINNMSNNIYGVNNMINENVMNNFNGMTRVNRSANFPIMMNNGNNYTNVQPQPTYMNHHLKQQQPTFQHNGQFVPNMNIHNTGWMGNFKNAKNNENSSIDSWDNFPLIDRTKASTPENDYFKIFNYGIYNNIDKKFYENCDVYKNHMEQFDKSLFIQ